MTKMAAVNFMRAITILAVKAAITAPFVLKAAVVESATTWSLELLHGNQIGGPWKIDWGPRSDHHPLSFGHPSPLEGGGDPLAYDFIDVGEFGHQDGVHTPGEDELPDRGGSGAKGEDGIARPVAGDQASRPSRKGRRDDGGYFEVRC